MSEAQSNPVRDIDQTRVKTSLERLARTGQPPWLHGEVARRMGERLALVLARPQVLLDWWGFAGASAPVLLKTYPHARRVVVEPTASLRERSRRAAKTPWWSVRRWRESPAAVVSPEEIEPASAQLVWANMMLHASADPVASIAKWHRALAVEGFLMFSCLGPGSLRELRELYQRLGWPPAMADFIDMHDLGDMLVQAGFADPVMDQETLSLSWEHPQALLDELRTLGGNAAPGRFAGLRTPRWREQLLQELSALSGADGRIRLSIEVAYGHAFKAAPRVPVSSQTTVSLDDMRALVRGKAAGA